MIKSIGFDQNEIIGNILNLHCKEYIQVDPTFSKGNFYKNRPRPKYCFDIAPQFDFVIQADCRNLPLASGRFETVILDGPFGVGSGPSLLENKNGQNIVPGRFGCFRTGKELTEFYQQAVPEMFRILASGGILIQKIQPVVGCGRQWITHVVSINTALTAGFIFKDEFILLAKQRPISGKIKKQQHARKFHSYFYVFKKGA